MKIAILGAECTGKTTLAQALCLHFQMQHRPCSLITEYLREWCALHARTPRQDEQLEIAQIQCQRVLEASNENMVIADTTAFMTAVYSDFIFKDSSLYAFAIKHQRAFDVTLVCGLDIPWEADGIQRDGAHVREEINALIRQNLRTAHLPFYPIIGHGPERTAQALAVITKSTRNLHNFLGHNKKGGMPLHTALA